MSSFIAQDVREGKDRFFLFYQKVSASRFLRRRKEARKKRGDTQQKRRENCCVLLLEKCFSSREIGSREEGKEKNWVSSKSDVTSNVIAFLVFTERQSIQRNQ